MPLADPRQLQPAEREPALRRRSLVERRHRRHARSRASTSRPTSSPARRRRPAPPGATTPSTAPTSRCTRSSRPCPGSTTSFACTCACTNPAASSGYMLRTNQLSGTDEVWLERFDIGRCHASTDDPQELTVGDTLLLRAKGTSIEAWRLTRRARGHGSASSRMPPTARPASSASACAGRPAVSTTSVAGRSAARRPTRRLPPHPAR